MTRTLLRSWTRAVLVCIAAAAPVAAAQDLAGAELVQALRAGGHVLVIRNARSPEDVPEESRRAPANLTGEREIDQHGQGQMAVIGYAFRVLGVAVDHTLTSPAYRSRQSGNYLGFGTQAVVANLAENADAAWLAQRVAEPPAAGRNTVIVTHASLIERAFGADARGIDNAETLIYRPHEGRAELVARLAVEAWAKLAVAE